MLVRTLSITLFTYLQFLVPVCPCRKKKTDCECETRERLVVLFFLFLCCLRVKLHTDVEQYTFANLVASVSRFDESSSSFCSRLLNIYYFYQAHPMTPVAEKRLV